MKERLVFNKTKNLEVAIIGAGISGLCSALFLKRLGCNVTVFEKDKSFKREGAGIQITSNGLFVLEKLGLEKLVVASGLKPKHLCFFDENDFKSIGTLEILQELNNRYGRPFTVLRRSFLIKILYKTVKEEKIKIKFGFRALPLIGDDRQDIQISYKGEKIEKDLIVVADGVGSMWKKSIFKEIKTRSVSQSAYRFLLRTNELPSIFLQDNINLFFGKGRHFVTYPTGDKGMINFVFCKRERGQTTKNWREKVSKQQFLNDFNLNKGLEICLPKVQKIYRWPMIESEIPITIQKKNVVMVGDAAHGMLPYLAQGANKALEDSWELAKCIEELPLDLKEALSKYSKKRIKRINQLDRVSKFNERVYHLEKKVLRKFFLIFLQIVTKLFPSFFFKRLDWIYKYKG